MAFALGDGWGGPSGGPSSEKDDLQKEAAAAAETAGLLSGGKGTCTSCGDPIGMDDSCKCGGRNPLIRDCKPCAAQKQWLQRTANPREKKKGAAKVAVKMKKRSVHGGPKGAPVSGDSDEDVEKMPEVQRMAKRRLEEKTFSTTFSKQLQLLQDVP